MIFTFNFLIFIFLIVFFNYLFSLVYSSNAADTRSNENRFGKIPEDIEKIIKKRNFSPKSYERVGDFLDDRRRNWLFQTQAKLFGSK